MHSSRMRNASLLPVSSSMHCSREGGRCTCPGGVPGWGVVYLPRGGVPAWGVPAWGCTCRGGTCPGTAPAPCGQTDTCKNITFAKFLLRAVKLLKAWKIMKSCHFKKRGTFHFMHYYVYFTVYLQWNCL